jgi:serine protease Do
MRRLLVLIAVAGLAWGQTARVRPHLADYSQDIEDLVRKASPGVVQIFSRGYAPVEGKQGAPAGFISRQEGTGSGMIIDPSGYIVTNAHVVFGARRITVALHGREEAPVTAKLVGLDRRLDIAVIKMEGANLPALPFADSSTLKQGQFVMALGSPLGLQNSVSVGIVSATQRVLKPEEPVAYIQTDAPINPGNSGGPLLNVEGRVVGMNTMIMSQSGGSEGIGFAIPSDTVQRIYELIRKDGRVKRGSIGVVAQTITPEMAAALSLPVQSGAILADVLPRSAAEAAGLQVGDILVSVDGRPVKEVRDLMRTLYLFRRGEETTIEFLRGGQKQSLKVALVEKPSTEDAVSELLSVESQLIRRLGILAAPLDASVNALVPGLRKLSGVAVVGVAADYAALNPGLQSMDVIYAINNQPVATVSDVIKILNTKKPGDPVVLQVERQGSLGYLTFEIE